jgi:hypothetical protein
MILKNTLLGLLSLFSTSVVQLSLDMEKILVGYKNYYLNSELKKHCDRGISESELSKSGCLLWVLES